MEGRYVVYFIAEQPFIDRVKIGKTSDVESRMKSLQTGNPNRLCLLKEILVDSQDSMNKLETKIHREMKERNILGEWFQMTLGEIEELYNKYYDEINEKDEVIGKVEIPVINIIVGDNIKDFEVNVIKNNEKKCYSCGKKFRTPAEYKRHKNRKTPCLVREVSPENLNNPNRCFHCNNVFAQKQTLTRHLKTCRIKNMQN